MAQVKLKGSPVRTNGSLPKIGQKSPDLRGVDTNLAEKNLKDFAGKKKIVCFVPSLDTSVCSTSAQKFSKEVQKLKNTVVIYLSVDTPFALKRVCVAEHGIDQIIPLSLVRSKKTAEDFGMVIQDGPLTGCSARAVVVLNEKDEVVYTELVEEISTEPNYEKALAAAGKND